MRRTDDAMPVPVDERPLLLRVRAPEDEDEMFALGDQRPHNRIRKRLPPVALMRARAMRRHGQRSVEKKNALVGPTQQIRHSLSSVSRLKSSSILRQLLRDVDERRRCLNLRRDIEREALSLTGLAGGAALAGCCAQMVGFAVMSFRENKWGGLVSQGIGTSMLQMGNILRNPRIWIPPIATGMITGPVATCIFRLEMNGAAINSGMGTCGLCGPIGVWTGWVEPSAAALANGATAITAGASDWLGLALVSIVLPAIICPLVAFPLRKAGWIKDGDCKLN